MAFARNKQTKPFVEQWHRTGRWFERLKKAYGSSDQEAPPDEMMDLFYTFFQNCFMMRDWMISSGVNEKAVSDLFQSEPLALCRDIANGTKLCEITRASVDSGFMTVMEYDPPLKSSGSKRTFVFRLLSGGEKYYMYGLALKCLATLQGFFVKEELISTKTELRA